MNKFFYIFNVCECSLRYNPKIYQNSYNKFENQKTKIIRVNSYATLTEVNNKEVNLKMF